MAYSQLYNIDIIFKDACLEIPKNQRGYSWTSEHVDALLDDIQLMDKKSHYLGPILISKLENRQFTDAEGSYLQSYSLIDGQQRMTTYFIILKNIYNNIIHHDDYDNVNGKPEKGRKLIDKIDELLMYELNGQSAKKYRLSNAVVSFNNTLIAVLNGLSPTLNDPPSRCLYNAYNHVSKYLEGKTLDQLMNLYSCLIKQGIFAVIDLNEYNLDRYFTFEVVNSRGLALSQFDKIKNYAMLLKYQIESRGGTLTNSPEAEWYKSISFLSKFNVGSRSLEDTFINDCWIVFSNKAEIPISETHEKFVNTFKSLLEENDDDLIKLLDSFISGWAYYAESFGFVNTSLTRHGLKDASGNSYANNVACDWLVKIDNLGFVEVTRRLRTVCHLKMKKHTDFAKFVEFCEKFTFRVYGGVRAGSRTSAYSPDIVKLCQYHYHGKAKPIDVMQQLCYFTTTGPNKATLQMCSDFILAGKDDVKYPYDYRVNGWRSGCYYFLYEYEIGVSPTGTGTISYAEDKKKKQGTIEHIMPKSHRNLKDWQKEWHPDTAELNKHRLGNLVLTTDNQRLGVAWIDKKLNNKAKYCFNDASATNSEKEISKFTNGTHWNIADMMKREIEAMKFFIDRWRLDCWDEDQKITINSEYCNTIKGSKKGVVYAPVSKIGSFKVKLPSFCLTSVNLFADDEEHE